MNNYTKNGNNVTNTKCDVLGSSKSRVLMHSYPSSFQEFTGKEGSSKRLSQWSLDGFKMFLQSAKSDRALFEQLQNDGVIFFLHLLGIDTSGHSDKPHSM